MNRQNVEYLKEGLKYLGFGDGLDGELIKNIQRGLSEFQLHLKQLSMGKAKMDFNFHFKKSEQGDVYVMNKYDATLKRGNDSSHDVKQTFDVKKNEGITAREALNLLEGRAVHKELTNNEGEKMGAWQQLDFNQKDDRGNFKLKQYDEKSGYNLEKALLALPIKEMNQSIHPNVLLYHLQKGNLHEVTMDRGNKLEQMYIEANPQARTINVYDSHFKKVEKEALVHGRPLTQTVTRQDNNKVRQGFPGQERRLGVKNKGDNEDGSFHKSQKRTRKRGLSH